MTTEQSRTLKIGARVCWNSDKADQGIVTANLPRYVKIKWADGHDSLTGHGDMRRVELLRGDRK